MAKVRNVLKTIRRDFVAGTLGKYAGIKNPIRLFETWMEEILSYGSAEPNAMTLATISANGQPDIRVVLLRDVTDKGFSFFTNYKSSKGKQLATRKKAALNFYWPEMHRQVRILGTVQKLSAKESTAYFNSRPRESQLGAWTSQQSKKLESREALEEVFRKMEIKYQGKSIPRPPHWGGYRLKPSHIEFWQGRANRLHDRILFEKGTKGQWKISLLQP